MKRSLLAMSLAVIMYAITPAANAGNTEVADLGFLKTGQNIYQSSAGTDKVIIVPDVDGVPGVFISTGVSVPLQNFHPSHLIANETSSMFIRFDPQKNNYSSLHVGEQSYKIVGQFTVDIVNNERRLQVTVDNTNPYLSIVATKTGAAEDADGAILGIVGLSVAVNQTGQTAVALLAANQFNEYRGIVEPYTLTHAGLTLRGEPIVLPTIGLNLEQPRNHCLDDDAVLISEEELKAVRQTADLAARIAEMEKLLAGPKKRLPASGILVLRSDRDVTIGLDYLLGEVKTFRYLKGKVCVVEKVNFDT